MKSVSGVGSKGEDRCRGGWHRWDVWVSRTCLRGLFGGFRDGKLAMFVNTSAFLFSPSVFVVVPSPASASRKRGGEDGIIVSQFLLRPKTEWRTY